MDKALLIKEETIPKDCEPSDTRLLYYDLSEFVGRMKQNSSWIAGELCARIIQKKKNKKIILTAMHEGTIIESFQSNDSITLQIIEGSLIFHTRRESVTLKEGQRLSLHEKIKYRLTTTEDSVFLLTIATSTVHQRKN